MAVTKLQTGCSLGIEVQKGTDKLGDPIYTKKNFSNVNPKKTPDEVFEVAKKFKRHCLLIAEIYLLLILLS